MIFTSFNLPWPRGVPTLVGGIYLGGGEGVPTLAGGGLPLGQGGTHLGRGVPTLAGGTYLGQGGTYLGPVTGVPPRKDMGPVEVLWMEMGYPPGVNRQTPVKT